MNGISEMSVKFYLKKNNGFLRKDEFRNLEGWIDIQRKDWLRLR